MTLVHIVVLAMILLGSWRYGQSWVFKNEMRNEKGEMEMTLYMAVTPDEYELPIAVADGPTELARKFNLNKSTVLGSIIRKQNGKTRGIRFERVEIDE